MTKPKIGVFSITGCAGCQLSIIFNEDDILDLIKHIDFRAFPFIKEVNPEDNFDYIFLEGLVASKGDLKTLYKLRGHTKKLIALGACSCTGCVPAYRKFTLKENYEHLLYKKIEELQDVEPTPIDAHVEVDYTIPGCPPDKREIKTFIKEVILGKEPRPHQSPVCVECRRNNNHCLLDLGKACLGPITVGGCDSVCINGGFECWGCRGPTKDMNLQLMINILKHKGYDQKFIENRIRTFAGLKINIVKKVLDGNNNA